MKTKTDCGCEKDVFDCWAQGDPQHTPTPWKWSNGQLVGSDGFVIAEKNDDGSPDAAYIVRAVNAHEELLEACKYAFQHLKPSGDVRKDYSGHLAMATLSNAIAKAEGK